ncbi:MAG: major capsid protein [Bacteroidaceae bacterium]|nr:major capsid protein [Bacteroidaceae bacterium]
MRNNPVDFYKLLEFGLGGDTWQQFVDRYKEKYDGMVIDGFEFAPTSINYTWQQLVAATTVTTLPTYVDPESPGYEKQRGSAKGETGSIPTQKAFYSLNRTIVREKMQLMQMFGQAALNQDMMNVIMGLLDESADGLIKGYYNSLTNQRMQIVSTGKFKIDATNNPRGIKDITFDFGIDESHFDTLSGTQRWWTNADKSTEGTASDPIAYMKNKVKEIRSKYHYYGPLKIEMAKEMMDALLSHSKVLKRIGMMLYPLSSVDNSGATALAYAQNLADDAIKQALVRLVGCEIVERDSKAYVDDWTDDGVLTQKEIENFSLTNISFIPQGTIGNIQGVTPLTMGYEPSKVAFFDDNRLVLSQRMNPETHSIYIESEAAELCVPSLPKYMFICTVCA